MLPTAHLHHEQLAADEQRAIQNKGVSEFQADADALVSALKKTGVGLDKVQQVEQQVWTNTHDTQDTQFVQLLQRSLFTHLACDQFNQINAKLEAEAKRAETKARKIQQLSKDLKKARANQSKIFCGMALYKVGGTAAFASTVAHFVPPLTRPELLHHPPPRYSVLLSYC